MDTSQKLDMYRQAHSLVKKIRRRSIKKMEIYKTGDFYPSDFRVLSILELENGKSIGDITKKWSMQYSNVTNIVNLLVQKGYATKKKSDIDKRKSMVLITREGIIVRDKIFKESETRITECLENVESEKITAALEAINEVLDQMQEKK